MITPQYTFDSNGKKIGVFLPIDDWYELKKIPGVENIATEDFSVPVWQVELGKAELDNLADGKANLIAWEEVKNQFKV